MARFAVPSRAAALNGHATRSSRSSALTAAPASACAAKDHRAIAAASSTPMHRETSPPTDMAPMAPVHSGLAALQRPPVVLAALPVARPINTNSPSEQGKDKVMPAQHTSRFKELDDDMLSALLGWRHRHGRSWKIDLWAAWMNGTDERDPRGPALRAIRNRLGPTWLYSLRPKALDAEAARRGVTAARPSPGPATVASPFPSRGTK